MATGSTKKKAGAGKHAAGRGPQSRITSEKILDNVPTRAVAIDRDLNVLYMNPAGAAALGRTPEACLEQKCFSLFNTAHCNTADCQVAKAMQQDGVFTADTIAGMGKVAAASRQTAAGATEVAKPVESIGAVTEQSTASAHQISALAADLQDLVVQFKTDNGKVEVMVGAAGGPVAETD